MSQQMMRSGNSRSVILSGLLAGLGLTSLLGSAAAVAQEQGRVISTTPVIQQVAVPRQVCATEQVITQQQNKSGGGALMGGIMGGLLGNTMGKGGGRAAMTGVGVMAGAIMGDKLEEGRTTASTQNVQRCTTQTVYENRTMSYNVVYEFNGKQYQVQMPQDPGPYVSLQVTPVAQPATVVQPAPVIVPAPAPAPVIVRPVTQAPVYVEPVVVSSYTYVQPAPVYVAPAVVYRPAPYHHHRHDNAVMNIGYYGRWN